MQPPDLDPVIHQRVRLAILAALVRNREASFTSLRDGLGLTDGNLATHAGKLEEAGYVKSGRVLNNATFQLRYRVTPEGVAAFRAYAEALRGLLDIAPEPAATARRPVDDAAPSGG